MEQKTAGLPKDDAFGDLGLFLCTLNIRQECQCAITMKRSGVIRVLIFGLMSLAVALTGCGKEDVPVQVQFKPVITAVGAQRNGSDVTFTAIVSDEGPQGALKYCWGFDGGLPFVNNTTNPAVLQGYDETRSGNLTLTVTNGAGGATTVSYYIAPRLLPDNVVIVVSQTAGAILGIILI